MKMRAGEKKGYYRTPDFHLGNRPHMAKFKVVRNVHLFASFSIDSNLQDEIAGQNGRGWFANLTGEDLQKIIDKDSKQKYLWGIVKQIQHGYFEK